MLVSRKTSGAIISQVNVNTRMIAEVVSFSEGCKKQTKSNFGNERWAFSEMSAHLLSSAVIAIVLWEVESLSKQMIILRSWFAS